MVHGKLLETAVERVPLTEHVGKSGAVLERMLLADGRRVVVKRYSPRTDLAMALTGDDVGREYELWSSGVLDRLPPQVGHAVIDGWREPDVTVVVMRDLGDTVLGWTDRLSRERCRWMLEQVSTMHRAFLGQPPPGLTPLDRLIGLFAPDRLRPHAEGSNPLPAVALRGWEVFADSVPVDVLSPVLSLLDDPSPLVDALERRPVTLVHGDLATVNMAIEGSRLTLLDWTLATRAPAALDLTWFLAACASVVDATREQVIADFETVTGAAYDEPALRLALLAALVWLGWNKALDAAEHPDPEVRDRERADLDWWLAQARLTLEMGLL